MKEHSGQKDETLKLRTEFVQEQFEINFKKRNARFDLKNVNAPSSNA